jgi:hypothetical protein
MPAAQIDENRLSPTEEATANAIETDFTLLFERWTALGYPREVIVPMALITAIDAAKGAGVSFETVLETLKLIWFGDTKPS